MTETREEENAWNPGLQSDIPKRLWPLVTLFREEHAFVGYEEARELADLTGLDVLDLISLRPERLVTHALLVRVTSELTVPDGPSYEELGINLRGMVARIHDEHVSARMSDFADALERSREDATHFISEKLEALVNSPAEQTAASENKLSFMQRLFGKPAAAERCTPSAVSAGDELLARVNQWKEEAAARESGLERACLFALHKNVGTIITHRGRMLPDVALVTRITANSVLNEQGSLIVDEILTTFWDDAIRALGYRQLPVQEQPVVMNVKGASASGKSTIRPQQRKLARKLGIPWEDFALISPDYWRKYLLDYATLGEDYKYGAMLTGRELEIIDRKLDAYMAEKAACGRMSHLLIDRFRFDSFSVDIDRTSTSKLLSRFADHVYLFFMVTHPAETVERAWIRGRKTGRYKAVDDLLFHNVEAFTGMPALFLSWVTSRDRQIHFEFLDNDVPEGTLPKTAAFGQNNLLVVLDVALLLNIDRNRKINISARSADEIFEQADLEPAVNTDFVLHCASRVDRMIFANQETMTEYAIVYKGQLVWWDNDFIQQRGHDAALTSALGALGYDASPCDNSLADFSAKLEPDAEKLLMVGHWSER